MTLLIRVFCLTLLLTGAVSAQVDNYGKTDTIYADIEKLNDQNWTVTISIVNDEYIAGLSIPLHLSAGTVRIVGDSAVYTGGRVEHFAYKAFRPDTAIQCVTMGMVANLGPTHYNLPPGSGRLLTLFISSFDKKPIEKLKVDTTTTTPNNSLMAIADYIQWTDPPDTLPLDQRKKAEIVPVFVVREPK